MKGHEPGRPGIKETWWDEGINIGRGNGHPCNGRNNYNRRPKVVLVLVFRVMGWYGSVRTGKTVHSSVLAVVLASKVVKTGQKKVKKQGILSSDPRAELETNGDVGRRSETLETNRDASRRYVTDM